MGCACPETTAAADVAAAAAVAGATATGAAGSTGLIEGAASALAATGRAGCSARRANSPNQTPMKYAANSNTADWSKNAHIVTYPFTSSSGSGRLGNPAPLPLLHSDLHFRCAEIVAPPCPPSPRTLRAWSSSGPATTAVACFRPARHCSNCVPSAADRLPTSPRRRRSRTQPQCTSRV